MNRFLLVGMALTAIAAAEPAAAQTTPVFPGLNAPSVNTQSFRAEALRTDAYDIAAARMALERSRDETVLAYARRTIDEHRRTTEALLPPGASLNVTGNVTGDRAGGEAGPVAGAAGLVAGTVGAVAGATAGTLGLTGGTDSVVIDNDPNSAGRRVALDPARQSMLNGLAPLAGPDFDQAYARQQIQSNERVLALYENYRQSGDNPTARTFATEAIPALQGRLAGSERLNAHLRSR